MKISVSRSVISIIEYLFVAFLILDSNSVYRQSSYSHYITIACTVFAVFLLVYILVVGRFRINIRSLYITAFIVVYGLLYILLSDLGINAYYVITIIIMLPCLMLIFSINAQSNIRCRLLYKYSDLIVWLACISLVLWVMGAVIGIVPTNSSIAINWGYEHTVYGFYKILYLTQTDTTFGISIFRNTSIFCEAPMYSLVLSLALMIEMFFRTNIRKTRITLLVISIFSTISLTGIIIISLCFCFKYWSKVTSMKGRNKAILIIIFGMAVIVGGIFLFKLFYNYKADTISYQIRLIEYKAGLEAWLENPIWGNGFASLSQLQYYANLLGINSGGYSNSLFAILSQGGIWLFILYIMPIYKLYRTDNNCRYIAIIYIILMISTIFNSRLIAMLFVAFGYSYYCVPAIGNLHDINHRNKLKRFQLEGMNNYV